MNVRTAALTGAIALAAMACAAETAAQDSALVSLHALRREGGKLCMVDHEHNGSSSGLPSRRAAEVAAARDWAGFTAWEYGPAWGNFALAGSKRMNCSQSGGSWACDTAARPCRPGR